MTTLNNQVNAGGVGCCCAVYFGAQPCMGCIGGFYGGIPDNIGSIEIPQLWMSEDEVATYGTLDDDGVRRFYFYLAGNPRTCWSFGPRSDGGNPPINSPPPEDIVAHDDVRVTQLSGICGTEDPPCCGFCDNCGETGPCEYQVVIAGSDLLGRRCSGGAGGHHFFSREYEESDIDGTYTLKLNLYDLPETTPPQGCQCVWSVTIPDALTLHRPGVPAQLCSNTADDTVTTVDLVVGVYFNTGIFSWMEPNTLYVAAHAVKYSGGFQLWFQPLFIGRTQDLTAGCCNFDAVVQTNTAFDTADGSGDGFGHDFDNAVADQIGGTATLTAVSDPPNDCPPPPAPPPACQEDAPPTVTPNINSSAVSYFGGIATSWPAGTYIIKYVSGALNWDSLTHPTNNLCVNYLTAFRYRVVYADSGAATTPAPGTFNRFSTQADVEADNADQYITITHTGGPIGVWPDDTGLGSGNYYKDNVLAPGGSAPTFSLCTAAASTLDCNDVTDLPATFHYAASGSGPNLAILTGDGHTTGTLTAGAASAWSYSPESGVLVQVICAGTDDGGALVAPRQFKVRFVWDASSEFEDSPLNTSDSPVGTYTLPSGLIITVS